MCTAALGKLTLPDQEQPHARCFTSECDGRLTKSLSVEKNKLLMFIIYHLIPSLYFEI